VAELVSLESENAQLLVLIFDEQNIDSALAIQAEAIAAGYLVRLETRPKKLNTLLDALKSQGFSHFAVLEQEASSLTELNIKPIG
jgi:histidyl-tRNA synthetase